MYKLDGHNQSTRTKNLIVEVRSYERNLRSKLSKKARDDDFKSKALKTKTTLLSRFILNKVSAWRKKKTRSQITGIWT